MDHLNLDLAGPQVGSRMLGGSMWRFKAEIRPGGAGGCPLDRLRTFGNNCSIPFLVACHIQQGQARIDRVCEIRGEGAIRTSVHETERIIVRMIPAEMPPLAIDANPRERAGHKGESKVFDLLRQLDRPGFVTVQTPLHDHEFKKVAEADFIVVVEEGVFVLEVKASSQLRRDGSDGRWRDGDRILNESPWQQAQGAMHAVEAHFRSQSMAWRPLYGFGVALVGSQFPRDTTAIDVESRTIMDRLQVTRGVEGMAEYLNDMIGYWISKFRDQQGHSPRRLSEADLEELEAKLAPGLDLRPSLATVAGDVRQTLDQLTADQYRIVRKHRDARKVIEGGAGTGKTFAAVELCKDVSASGESVGLVVKSVGLARFLRARLEGSGVMALALRELEDKQEDGEAPRFDLLVVDEGQDLLDEASLAVLDRTLDGGMAEGRWRWFMDPNNQAGLHGQTDNDVLAFIRDAADGEPWPLDENCRNTAPMVEEIQGRLQADLGAPSPDAIGPSPDISTSGKTGAETQAKRLADDLRELLDQGTDPGDISVVVVAGEAYLDRILAAMPTDLARLVRRFTATDLDAWPPRGSTLAMLPSEIKGLENDHIVVVEGDDLGEDAVDRRSGVYVGMTRGRVSLRAHLRKDLAATGGISS